MAQPPPLQPQDGYDLIKNIREWQSRQQENPPGGAGDETLEHLEISRLSKNLLSLFKEVILSLREQATIPNDARISLERSCSAFILWSEGYGVAQGHLNDIFRRSSKLRYILLKNLSRLGRALIERLIPLADISSENLQQLCSSAGSSIEKATSIINEELCRRSDDSSSDAGSTFSDDNIYEVAEDLKTDTCVLSSLDPLIKYPIFDLQKDEAVEDYIHSTWSPVKFFVDTIVNRFPLIDRSIASRLGQTNYECYLRRQADIEGYLENEEGMPSTQQEAPEVAGTIITKSKFHDSGVGTSIVPTVVRPEKIMSRSRKDQSVRIPSLPPLPKGAKAGIPFSCITCSRTVVITSHLDWKRHVFLDLQPYVCLDVSCSHSSTTFESREKWISHLASDHEMEPNWDSIECPFCKHVTGSGELAVTGHLSKHLEEISLLALPIGVNSNETSENGSELGDSDDDGENSHEISHPNTKDKGKSTAVADYGPTNGEQNTPCNILYVNLPIEASEEELKAILSKQQGFKRALFRTTQTYPLRFVEFDDTSSALKAILDLHGKPQPLLRNVERGILLSFANDFRGQLGELGIGGSRPDSWPKPLPTEIPPLPPGWATFCQEKTHRVYYYNSNTNVTHWEEPLFNPLYNPPPNMSPIHQGWIPLFDHGYQRWYYVNQETGRIQWEAPCINPPYNPPPVPQGWIALFDRGHQRWYYVNQETGRTQWDTPGINSAAFREDAEQEAQKEKEQAALEADERAAVISKKKEEEMAGLVVKKEQGDEHLREDNDTSQNLQTLNTQNMATPIRDPSRTVMDALVNPFLPGSDWKFISYEGKAGTETIDSQTTALQASAAETGREQAAQEEVRVVRKGIRVAKEEEQTAPEEEETAQEAKASATREAENQAAALAPREIS